MIVIGKWRFEETCMACPEQYDIHREHAAGDIAYNYAYGRLRGGKFQVSDEPLGKVIYSHEFNAPYLGRFPSDEIRMEHLNAACQALEAWHNSK